MKTARRTAASRFHAQSKRAFVKIAMREKRRRQAAELDGVKL